ncbi:MAG TPA: methyl-accepting chemotaxis protein [Bryobacteraceae bacterium]|nr:methyl-accepting chemotaxis protein [Bryobacteraceae bacterium]
MLELAQEGKRSEAGAAFQVALPLIGAMETAARDYSAFRAKRLDEANQKLHASISRIWLVMILFGVVAVVTAGIFGTLLSRSIAKPLEAAVGHLDEVARGDISRDLPNEYLARKDEIGLVSRALQTMSASLRDMMRQMGEGLHLLSSSSAELSASSGQMSSGSRHASEKVHSVAAAAEQMSAISLRWPREWSRPALTSPTSPRPPSR